MMNRRKCIKKLITSSIISTTSTLVVSPAAVHGKEASTSAQTLSEAFKKVNDELTSTSGGIQTLTTMIENKEWENIKEYTKNYDIEFRKEMMGSTRKLIPKNDN